MGNMIQNDCYSDDKSSLFCSNGTCNNILENDKTVCELCNNCPKCNNDNDMTKQLCINCCMGTQIDDDFQFATHYSFCINDNCYNSVNGQERCVKCTSSHKHTN